MRYNAASPVETITREGERRTIVPQGTPVTRNTLNQLRTLTGPAEQSIRDQRNRTGQFSPRPADSEGYPSYAEGGQQFGLPEGDPNTTMRGKFAQFMGSPMGSGLQIGGAALGGAALGFAVGGPVGAALGGLAAGGLTYGGMEYQKYLEHAYGLAEAQKRFDESFFGQMGKVLDVPREGLERVIGTGVQLAADPADTLANLDAAWKAARLTYESAPVDIRALDPGRWLAGTTPSLINTGSFQTFVDYDLPEATGGLMALIEARRRIAAGEPEANVFAEIQGRYGAPGQLRELLSGFVLDPLNYTGPLENLGVRGVARLARADDLAQAARLARTQQALGGGLIDTFQIYRNLKTMQVMREGFQDARSLNWLQKALVGEDILKTLDGTYTAPKPWELWRLTPESLARERVVQASNYLQSYVSGAIPLDENFPTESARLIAGMRTADLNGNVGELTPAARAMLTLEGQVVQKGLRQGGAVEADLLRAWQDTATERRVLDELARTLKQTPAEVITRAASGEDVLRLLPTPPPNVTAKAFSEIAKTWQGGVPHSLPEYRAALMSGLIEQSGQWAAKFFQLQGPGFIERLTGTIKAVQSPILLGLNPGYLINNILSNGVTSVARGALGLRGLTDIIDDLNKHGLSPARLAQGVTAAELDELGGGAKLWGERMADAGARPIAEAVSAPDGPLSKVRQAANKIADMAPFLKWSQKAEKAFSVATYGEGFRQMWSKVWRRGVGFDPMPKALEQALAELDPRLPQHIYAAVEAGYNASDIAAKVLEAAPRPRVQEFYGSVARTLGLDEGEFRDLLQMGGVEQALNNGLAQLPDNPSATDVRRLMQDTRVEAEQHIAQLEAEQAKVQYDFAAQAAGANEPGLIDPGALLETFDAQRLRLTETFTSHKRLLEELWEERLRGAIDTRDFVTRYRQAGRDLYRNGLFVEEQASIDGLAAGLKRAQMPLDEGFTLAKKSQHGLAEDFFRYKEQRLDDFFALDKDLRTGEAWAQAQKDIDSAYTNLTGHTEQLQAAMDDYLAAAYERRFPGAGEQIKTWRELVREHDAAYTQAVTAHFEAARNLPDPQSRHRLWREFDAQMIERRKQWTGEEIQARRAAWESVPGQRNLEAGFHGKGESVQPESTPEALRSEAVAGVQLAEAARTQAVAAEFWDLERRMTAAGGDATPELIERYRAVESEYYRLFPEHQTPRPATPGPDTPPSAVTFNLSRNRTEIDGANLAPEQQALLKLYNWRKEKSTGTWYARGDFLTEGRQLVGELDMTDFQKRRATRLPPPAQPGLPPTTGTPESLTPAGAVRIPRSELPPALSNAIAQQAREMLTQVNLGEAGERVFVRGLDDYLTGEVLPNPSTYPDWYGAIGARKETITRALEKIIKDGGSDKDGAGQNIVRRLKQVVIDELAKTDPLTGRPPEPEILRWLGRSDEEINTAAEAWRAAGLEPQVQNFMDALLTQGGLTRQEFIDRLTNAFQDATPAEVQAVTAITDARAKAWAKQTGQPWENYYAARFADVRAASAEGGDLFQLATNEDVQARYAGARAMMLAELEKLISLDAAESQLRTIEYTLELGRPARGNLPTQMLNTQQWARLNLAYDEFTGAYRDNMFLRTYGRPFNFGPDDVRDLHNLFGPQALEGITYNLSRRQGPPTIDEFNAMRFSQADPGVSVFHRTATETAPETWTLIDTRTGRPLPDYEPFTNSEQPRAIVEGMREFIESGLYQTRGESLKKGSVEFMSDGRAIIRAFEQGDLSTMVHELGHVFRRDIDGDSLALAEQHYGVTGGKWKIEQEEKFARDFERYLRTADAPTASLRGVFEQLRAWLTEIYKSVQAMLTEPNAKIKKVFDRMLAVDEAAEQAGEFAVGRNADGRVLYQAEDGSLMVRRYRADEPEAQPILDEIEEISARARQRRDEAQDQSIRGLRPSEFDWMSDEELNRVNYLQTLIRSKTQAEAAADVARKRAARLAAQQGNLFAGTNEDLPLFSGTPAQGREQSFDPAETGQQASLFSPEEVETLKVQLRGAKRVADTPKPGQLFQEDLIRIPPASTATPLLPPGVLSDGGGQPTPHAAMQSEAYYRQLRPALAELQKQMEESVGRGAVRPLKGTGGHAGLPPELQRGIDVYLRQAGARIGEAKLMSMKWGEFKRDASLLNYSRRYVADTYLGMVAPYQFWSTHSMIKWAMHSVQAPALLAHYYRTKRFLETSVTKPGFPSRLMGKVKIPLPWMPDWMGGGVWVDPLKLGTPFESFAAPWENFQQGQLKLETRVQRELESMVERGEITSAEMQAALESRRTDMVAQVAGQGGNELWNRVSQRVVADDQSLRFDGGDLATMLYSPSLPLKWAYEALRGTPERISPLPVTRDVRNLTAALGVGGPGGVNLEGGVRRALGLPIFDQWGDYRIDRELSNMAGEGLISAEQAQAAMIERAGPAYDQAVQREAQQGGADANVQIFGRLFGGASVFPEGEQVQRQLNELFRAARQAQDEGEVEALNNFLEDHPEFEARLALNQEPAERLQNFLIDQVWSGWNALPELYKREVRAQLGETFEQAFMNRETRSYASIPPATLAQWARTLGRYIPGNVDGPAMQLELAPPEAAAEAQQYYDTRAAVFDMTNIRALQTAYFQIPDGARATREPLPEAVTEFYKQKESLFPDIQPWVSAYFDLPKGKPRREFIKNVPELAAYFAYERGWKQANPEEAAYLKSAPSARTQFMADHPELAQYWDWRRGWMNAHPTTASYLTEATPAGVGENTPAPTTTPTERRGVEIFASPEMQWLVTAHVFGGDDLPPAAEAALRREWEAQGEPEDSLDAWLINVLAYGGNLGMDSYLNLPQGYFYPVNESPPE